MDVSAAEVLKMWWQATRHLQHRHYTFVLAGREGWAQEGCRAWYRWTDWSVQVGQEPWRQKCWSRRFCTLRPRLQAHFTILCLGAWSAFNALKLQNFVLWLIPCAISLQILRISDGQLSGCPWLSFTKLIKLPFLQYSSTMNNRYSSWLYKASYILMILGWSKALSTSISTLKIFYSCSFLTR